LPKLEIYEPDLWGPTNAGAWIETQCRQWFDVCPVIA
jgi:glucose-6-phosphate 1-dehydrogenase